MLRNFITLKKLIEDFKFLKAFKVIECFTQDKNVVIINFFDGTQQTFLEINLNNGIESVFYHKNFFRARINSVDLFSEIIGLNLVDVNIYQQDRIIQFFFDTCIINIILYGFSKNNIILTDLNYNIIKSFKSKGEFDFSKSFVSSNESDIITLNDLLKSKNFNLSPILINEFCYLYDTNKSSKLSDYDSFYLDQITDKAQKFLKLIYESKKSFIIENAFAEIKFSLIKLTHFGDVKLEFNNINDGLRRFKSEFLSSNNLKAKQNEIKSKILRILKKQENQLINITTLLKNKNLIDDYRLYGDLLMSYPSPKKSGLKEISVYDWENNERNIKLNSMKTILENAQNYYNKSKKLKDEIEIKSTWLTSINNKIDKCEYYISELEKIEDIKELKKFEQKMKELETESNKAIENAESDKYRVFDLGSGFILYVGKNASNNDELTMKFAKANDLWMHARGSSGSHAVIRLKKEENPPKEIIKKAASIVAYYSQARNAKYVPVCYTFKKYVRKPKGANPGSVVLQKETVIMVEPKLPE